MDTLGEKIVTLSAADIGGSSRGATNLVLKLAVPSSISSSIGYAITFTGNYVAAGRDRNGVVSGQATTITIKEGDTITLFNNMNSGAYQLNIFRPTENRATDNNRVWNTNQPQNQPNGTSLSWTPMAGQSGTYYIHDDADYGYKSTLIVQPASPENITYTGFGTANAFYDKDNAKSFPWGVLKQTIQENKRYGKTYRAFAFYNNSTNLYTWQGSDFYPINEYNSTSFYYLGSQARGHRFCGSKGIDYSSGNISNLQDQYLSLNNFQPYYISQNYNTPISIGGNINYQLDLNVFRSGLDPRFAVLSFKAPTLSSSHLTDRTFSTFFLHNFNSDLWDYDHLFLGGMTMIIPEGGNTSNPRLLFKTYLSGSSFIEYRHPSRRTAEFGFSSITESWVEGFNNPLNTYFYSSTFLSDNIGNENRIYNRDSTSYYKSYGTSGGTISPEADFNAVIKGIPLSTSLLPVPYYLPDDFVLIDFKYNLPGVNIQQGDTITINGNEQYVVITGSYNQTGITEGILFCGRSV